MLCLALNKSDKNTVLLIVIMLNGVAPKFLPSQLMQGTLTEVEGSVQLTSY